MDRNDLELLLLALMGFGLVIVHRYLAYVSPPKKVEPSAAPRWRGYLSLAATLFVWVFSAILFAGAPRMVVRSWEFLFGR